MSDPERTVASPLRDVPWLSAGVENARSTEKLLADLDGDE
jgi:hypothetical protein